MHEATSTKAIHSLPFPMNNNVGSRCYRGARVGWFCYSKTICITSHRHDDLDAPHIAHNTKCSTMRADTVPHIILLLRDLGLFSVLRPSCMRGSEALQHIYLICSPQSQLPVGILHS